MNDKQKKEKKITNKQQIYTVISIKFIIKREKRL